MNVYNSQKVRKHRLHPFLHARTRAVHANFYVLYSMVLFYKCQDVGYSICMITIIVSFCTASFSGRKFSTTFIIPKFVRISYHCVRLGISLLAQNYNTVNPFRLTYAPSTQLAARKLQRENILVTYVQNFGQKTFLVHIQQHFVAAKKLPYINVVKKKA